MKHFLDFVILHTGDYKLTVANIIFVCFILIASRIFLFVLTKFYHRFFQKKVVDTGRENAIIQFSKYIVYVITFLFVLQALGIQPSLIWGGAAALLVGVGLGLQQTFHDLFSGIILLVEGTIQIGDIVEVDLLVAKVVQIGLRTSKVVTRDNIVIIIPNSHLVSDNVINWSNNDDYTRFKVNIGVAYSSDIDLVESVIQNTLKDEPNILKNPPPQVQLSGYGNSSIDFDVYFFSLEFFKIEMVKSDIRKHIIKAFRANEIEIPFPQQDVWFKNNLMTSGKANDITGRNKN